MGSWRKVWDFSQPLTVGTGNPPDEEVTYGVAFVWRRFELPDLPQPMRACVMVTVGVGTA